MARDLKLVCSARVVYRRYFILLRDYSCLIGLVFICFDQQQADPDDLHSNGLLNLTQQLAYALVMPLSALWRNIMLNSPESTWYDPCRYVL